MVNKYSSLLAGLTVIVLLPSIRYDQVTYVNPAQVSAHRNLERARYYAGRSPGRYSGYAGHTPSNWYGGTSIQGSVNIQRYQWNATTVNRGSNNEAVNEVGVIGGR